MVALDAAESMDKFIRSITVILPNESRTAFLAGPLSLRTVLSGKKSRGAWQKLWMTLWRYESDKDKDRNVL